jgi:exosortase/archaeosortase family protein
VTASNVPRAGSDGWFCLAIPLILLGVEVSWLTLAVEYGSGPMAAVASPLVGQAAMTALVLLLLLRGADLARTASLGLWPVRGLWLLGNFAAFALLFVQSQVLTDPSLASVARIAAWVVLAIAVGMTALLAGASLPTLLEWTRLAWHQAIGCLVLAAMFAYLTPAIQQLWQKLGPATTNVSCRFLQLLHPGGNVICSWPNGIAELGVHPGARLMITPGCGEMESLAVFLLLGVTLLVAHWPAVRWPAWLAVVTVGGAILFLLNAVRFAILVEVAARAYSSLTAQRLAHSRISGMLFLALGAIWLAWSARWWRRCSAA